MIKLNSVCYKTTRSPDDSNYSAVERYHPWKTTYSPNQITVAPFESRLFGFSKFDDALEFARMESSGFVNHGTPYKVWLADCSRTRKTDKCSVAYYYYPEFWKWFITHEHELYAGVFAPPRGTITTKAIRLKTLLAVVTWNFDISDLSIVDLRTPEGDR